MNRWRNSNGDLTNNLKSRLKKTPRARKTKNVKQRWNSSDRHKQKDGADKTLFGGPDKAKMPTKRRAKKRSSGAFRFNLIAKFQVLGFHVETPLHLFALFDPWSWGVS